MNNKQTRIDTFNEKVKETGYIRANEMLAIIPLSFPQISHEYGTRGYLSAITDYGRWFENLEEIKTEFPNKEKEFYEEKLLEYFLKELTKEKNDSYQACQLFNNNDELAETIHILASQNGYCLKAYYGEGKRLTSEEKITLLSKELPEEIVNDIKDHFKEDHLIKILKGRKGIKTKRPDPIKNDGLDYYIWRMTRFNTGIDTTMPVIAQVDITSYFSQKIDGKKAYVMQSKNVRKAIKLVDLLVDSMNFKEHGFQSFSGAMVWAKALGIPM